MRVNRHLPPITYDHFGRRALRARSYHWSPMTYVHSLAPAPLSALGLQLGALALNSFELRLWGLFTDFWGDLKRIPE